MSRPQDDPNLEELSRTSGRLRRLARGLLYERGDADDVVQQAWLVALERGPRPGWPLRGWISGAVRNIARERRREETRRRRRERAAARPEAVPSAADSAARLELLQRLVAAVQSLEEPYRTTVLLRFFDGLTPGRIARRQGVPVETVRTRLRRGLERLRRDLTSASGDELGAQVALLVPLAGSGPPLVVALTGIVDLSTRSIMSLQTKAAWSAVLVVVISAVAWRLASSPEGPHGEGRPELAAPMRHVAPSADPQEPPEAARGEEASTAGGGLALPGRVAQRLVWQLAGRTLTGSGVPLAGVQVTARSWAGYEARGDPLETLEIASDAEGRFECLLEPPQGTVTLRLEASPAGHLPLERDVQVVRGTAPPATIDLRFSALDVEVLGTVEDGNGQPIAGAHVHWHSRLPTQTDAQGRFRLQAVSRYPKLYLLARAPGFTEEELVLVTRGTQSLEEVRIVLRPARRIRGRVLDPWGRPAPDAQVQAWSLQGSTTTDAWGRFELDHLDPLEDAIVFASKEGLVGARAEIQPGLSEVELELALSRGGEVSGRVLREEGGPLGGAQVFVGASKFDVGAVRALTDDDGRFVLGGVPAGLQQVGVEAEGRAALCMPLQAPEPGQRLEGLELVVSAGHHVGGRVVDLAGAPLAGVNVSARQGWDYLEVRARTDVQGRFRLEALPDGDLELELFGHGLVRLEAPLEELDRDDLELVMQPAAALAGRVIDGRTGLPLERFSIRLVQPRLEPGEQAALSIEASWVNGGRRFTDPDGRWSTAGEELVPGAVYAVEASADGYAPAVEERFVAQLDPDPDEHVLALFEGIELRGRVVAAGSGAPIAGALVTRLAASEAGEPFPSDESDGRFLARSDAAGWFSLDGLPPKAMGLRVEHPDWLAAEDGPIELSPGTTPLPRTIELREGAAIGGRLLDGDGHPLARQRIEIWPAEEPRRYAPAGSQLTDEEGAFRFAHLDEGLHQLQHLVQVGDFQALVLARAVLVPAEGEVSVELSPSGSARLDGRLVAEDELPGVAYVWLKLAGEQLPPERALSSERRIVAAQGSFSFEGLEAGDYQVSAQAYDARTATYWRASTRVTLRASGSAVVDLVLRP